MYDRYPARRLLTAAGRARAPQWTRECRNASGRRIARACVRLRGRVVWIQRHDPDGDGDRHLIVVSRLRLHIVKLPARFHVPLPALGRVVSATGFDETGGSGHDELHADRYAYAGRTYRARYRAHGAAGGS